MVSRRLVGRVPAARASVLLIVLAALAPAVPATGSVVEEDFTAAVPGGGFVHGKLLREGTYTSGMLIVLVHGSGETVNGTWLPYMRQLATDRIWVLGIDYRDNAAFPAFEAARDVNAAVKAVVNTRGTFNGVALVGVGEGALVATLAAAEHPLDKWGGTVYHHLVLAQGVTDAAGMRTAALARGDGTLVGRIDAAMGGAPEAAPLAYANASLPARAGDLAYLGDVSILHAKMDGVVPYAQARAAQAALKPVVREELTTILREVPGQPAGQALLGAPGFAGHAAAGDVGASVLKETARVTRGAVLFADILGGEHVLDAGARTGYGLNRDGTLGCLPC